MATKLKKYAILIIAATLITGISSIFILSYSYKDPVINEHIIEETEEEKTIRTIDDFLDPLFTVFPIMVVVLIAVGTVSFLLMNRRL